MAEVRARDSSRLGFLAVLVAAIAFLVSLFLPFASDIAGSSSIFASFSARPIPTDRLGDFLYLFGGIAVIVLMATMGLTWERSRIWAPKALPIVVATWALPWIGFVDNATSRSVHAFHVGTWLLSASVLAALAGATGAAVSADRDGSHIETPGADPPGLRSRFGYGVVLAASAAFVVSLVLPVLRVGVAPYYLHVSGISLWGLHRHIAAFMMFLGGLVVIGDRGCRDQSERCS
jgi:hypothetical protein